MKNLKLKKYIKNHLKKIVNEEKQPLNEFYGCNPPMMSGGEGNNCGVIGSNYDCQNGTGGILQTVQGYCICVDVAGGGGTIQGGSDAFCEQGYVADPNPTGIEPDRERERERETTTSTTDVKRITPTKFLRERLINIIRESIKELMTENYVMTQQEMDDACARGGHGPGISSTCYYDDNGVTSTCEVLCEDGMVINTSDPQRARDTKFILDKPYRKPTRSLDIKRAIKEIADPSPICTNCGSFVGQTWKDGFKTNMASKFGSPCPSGGCTRLNQIQGRSIPLSGKGLQAKNFLVKTKAKMVTKQNNVNQSQQPEHYNQLQYKIDHITMIAKNMFSSTI